MYDDLRLSLTLKPRRDIPFLFPSYRALINSLGAVDGLGAGLTLASRSFVEAARRDIDPQEFARMEAAKYSIGTAFVEFQKLTPHLSRLLIVGTNQQAEAFFTAFRREQNSLGRPWRMKTDSEAPLSHILDCLPGGLQQNIGRIWQERYSLHEYYRKIRNSFVHLSSKRTLDKTFAGVQELKQTVRDQYGLDAPNDFSSLTFDDHLLFTRLTKYIATDLCRLATPSNAEELKSVLVFMAPADRLSGLIRHRSEATTLQKALRGYFKDAHNFKLSNTGGWEDELLQWFADLPSKRERKRGGLGKSTDFARSTMAPRPNERANILEE